MEFFNLLDNRLILFSLFGRRTRIRLEFIPNQVGSMARINIEKVLHLSRIVASIPKLSFILEDREQK